MSVSKIIQELPDDVKDTLACANYLHIKPNTISTVHIEVDGGGHFTGLEVKIFIPTGRAVGQWIKEHLPKEITPEVEEFILRNTHQ